MIDQTTRLILNVGNVIHDDVCMALSRVNFKELEDAPHSDRVDEAAAKIIAMIEQDVARRLLSDEASGAGAMVILNERHDHVWLNDLARSVTKAEFAAIGITVEPQP